MGRKIQSGGQDSFRILLTGYVGNNNLGDDLMMMETINFLKDKYPKAEITVMVRYQGCKDRQNYGEDIRIVNLHGFRLSVMKEWIYGHLLINRYDLVLWVGGTCFADIGGNGLYSYFKHNIKRKIPYGYLGIGIDYFEDATKRKQAEELFSDSSLTVFRDEVSLKQAGKLVGNKTADMKTEFGIGEDIVYRVLNRIFPEDKKTDRLLISWRYQSQYMSAEAEEELTRILLEAVYHRAEEYREVVFLPIDEHMDGEVNRRLAKDLRSRLKREHLQSIENEDKNKADENRNQRLPKVRYIDHMEAEEKLMFIARSKSYICGRLHGVMIGEYAGCNVAALNYSLKMHIFMESIGRTCDVVPVNEMTEEKIHSALSAGVMENRKAVLKQKAKLVDKNYEYLAKVIDSVYR